MPSYKEIPFDSLYTVTNETDCWLWKGSLNTNGYGWHWIGPVKFYAHRFALMRATNTWHTKLFACHKCDNPACVNPSHLFWGTAKDNISDAARKGRMVRKNKAIPKKLSIAQVWEIYHAKGTLRDIGANYGVSRQTVANIKNRVGYSFLNSKE